MIVLCSVSLFLFYSYCPPSFLASRRFFLEEKARIKAFQERNKMETKSRKDVPSHDLKDGSKRKETTHEMDNP